MLVKPAKRGKRKQRKRNPYADLSADELQAEFDRLVAERGVTYDFPIRCSPSPFLAALDSGVGADACR